MFARLGRDHGRRLVAITVSHAGVVHLRRRDAPSSTGFSTGAAIVTEIGTAAPSTRRLHQLDPVAERVVDVESLKPVEGLVGGDLDSASPALGDNRRDVVDEE